ncbi:MAG: hypothetical protein PHN30_03510 [Bacteroidales bacterium]|nr:hypothetical protein [Bacteroidales bacterium]MDD2814073.1 hypothetical protein [Bacteroidales bacterium]MDD3384765.1 hypothetical protein [Bacteroidales bacterium]MDD3811498.1 hypothetical protein [Bacteroidales bacterium]MDD3872138.1 hypothetical protein [Bacteroidales bacterium]
MKKIISISLFICILSSINLPAQDKPFPWPERYSSTYGIHLERDAEGKILITAVDSTTVAAERGIVPGYELLAWNQLPTDQALKKIRVRRYRKLFPDHTDDQIRLILLTRGHPGDSAEVFVLTETENNRGIRLSIKQID